MEYALELEKVSKTYEKSGFCLDQISFRLPLGTVMGFVGENGAGKTTTIGCILNTLFKDSGNIRLFGQQMKDQDTALREKIGVVYDGDNFPAYLNAGQLEKVLQGLYRSWDSGLFSSYLERFGLKRQQKIGTYSKGMTMKLAIAAALSHHPKLLILDEATSGLDPVMRDDMLDLFLEFVGQEDHSILLSSHITSDLEKIADYITFLHNGRVLLTASKDELLYQYAVLRCKKDRFLDLDPKEVIAYRNRDLWVDVLVGDKKAARRKYPDIVADQVLVEEIMLILVKGEKGEGYERTAAK